MDTLLIINLMRGTARLVTLGGREYIVAPLTLIVPGVLAGSKGPLYYPPEVVGNEIEQWNGVPIVVYHPQVNGEYVSARDPNILLSYEIGRVYNTKFNGKLQAEGWFDVEQLRRVDTRVLNMLRNGDKIELSTGMILNAVPVAEGSSTVYNGVYYTHKVVSYRADHLAILPDKVGACSIKDGCGVLANELASWMVGTQIAPIKLEINVNKEQYIAWLITNCDCWKSAGDRELLNNFSEEKLKAMKEHEEKEKQKTAVVNAAKAGFEHGDVGFTFNEATGKWEVKTKTPPPVVNTAPVQSIPVAQPVKAKTAEEWLSEAPPEVRAVIQDGLQASQRQKQQLVDRLTANISDAGEKKIKNDRLITKSLTDLQDMVDALPPVQQPSGFGYQLPAPNYGGSVPAVNMTDDEKKDSLLLPVMNWAEIRKEQRSQDKR